MKKSIALAKVVKDTRRLKNDNSIPLKLRITFKGERKYYATGFSCSDDEWLIINSAAAKGSLRDTKNEIAIVEKTAEKVIDKIDIFSFKKFEDLFFEKPIKYESLENTFNAYIKNLRASNQIGTADSYETAKNSLLKFKPGLSIKDITVDFLKDYEAYMLEKEKSITTVGIYLRSLRTILNIAQKDGVLTKDDYPFGKGKYNIPSSRNMKKALTITEINKLFKYQASTDNNSDMAKDFWIFSYLCNGINITDIARLTWKDLDKKTITFNREKTKRSNRNDIVKIVALRNSYTDAIINKWGGKPTQIDSPIFNIISKKDSPTEARKKVQLFTKVLNKWLKRIGLELEFDLKLTTYVARHSFATVLVRNGAPLEFASQSLGHSNLLTTQKYFGGFDIEAQAEYVKALTDF